LQENEFNDNSEILTFFSHAKLKQILHKLLNSLESRQFNTFLLILHDNLDTLNYTLTDYNLKVDEYILVNNKLLNNKLEDFLNREQDMDDKEDEEEEKNS